ncbi:helix-turn-helix domain-containing protein [Edaphobacter aggregans]|uniref:helix-turn-helix domain-containing protein n=1 Tax=Edaphobacter aggregans TaxID=570835 RepID=UPI000A06D1BA
MSIAIMSRVWRHGPTLRSERLLLLAIADHADDKGVAWPSATTLAAKACMTTRTVSRALDSLKSAGWIEILPRTGQHGCHTYKLNLAKLNLGGNATPDKMSDRSGDKMSDRREPSPDTMSYRDADLDQTFTPLDQTLTTSRSDIDDISIRHFEQLNNIVFNHQEPPIEPPIEPPKKDRVSSPLAASEPEAIVLKNLSPTAQSASADDSLSFREAIRPMRHSFEDANHWELAAYLEFWNAASPRFKRAHGMTDRRVAKLQARIGGGMTTQGFMEAVGKVAASELCKRNRLTFEWLISDDNWPNGQFVCTYLDKYPFF